MALYVDVHAHMDWHSFDEDREQILKEMKEQGIMALSNTLNPANYAYTRSLYPKPSPIQVCPGLYPQDAEMITEKDMEDYLRYLKKNKAEFPAIGEVGLDRHHTTDPELWEIQEKRFRQMIELAIAIDKPLIIHTRKAEERVLEIIREYVEKQNFRKFLLHCFTGKKKLIKEIRELKVYCSIPLIIKNTESFRLLAGELPISQLFVETDAPYLHPEKIRNSPLTVPQTYEELARIKGYDTAELRNIIFRNYQRLFM